MKTPVDKTLTFSFISHKMKDVSLGWLARVTFPGGSDEGSVLPIEVVDGHGDRVGKAVLEIFGKSLPVMDGISRIKYADFVKGKHEKGVWLHRAGVEPVPGGLTFM